MPLKPSLPILAAARVTDVRPGTPIPPGVRKGVCAGCGCELYFAPSSRKLIAKGIAQPACADCAIRHLREAPRKVTVAVPPGAEDCSDWIGRN